MIIKPNLVSLFSAIILLAIITACGRAAPASTPAPTVEPATLALINGLLIDGTGAAPISNAVILLRRDKILAAGPADQVTVPAGVMVIDLGGAAVLPGFINAHVHKAFNKANLQAWAQGGVTTVRDEGGSPTEISGLQAYQAEVSADPHFARLVSAGAMLTVPGGYGHMFVSSAQEAQQAVLSEVGNGVQAVKVALEDGYAGAHDLPKLTPEELQTIVTTAHEHGLPVSGHITQAVYIRPLLEAGVDDIAHLAYDLVDDDTMKLMIQQGVYWIPTFTVFRNYGVPPATLVYNLTKFVKLGGKVGFGNDYGGGPGDFELGIPMYEVQMMSQAGMTPMQVIQAATQESAHILRLDGQLGTLQPGKQADILVVGGNPLEDLQALADVKLVIHAGAVIRDEASK